MCSPRDQRVAGVSFFWDLGKWVYGCMSVWVYGCMGMYVFGDSSRTHTREHPYTYTRSYVSYLRPMKILFIARSTLFKQPGGDTQQVTETARALQRLGIDVDIRLSGERVKVNEYDLVHFFNLGRPADLMRLHGWETKPLFISTIWVDYGDSPKKEWMKAITRGLFGNDRFPPLSYLLAGHEKSMAKVVEHGDLFITTTEREIDKLLSSFPDAKPTYVVHPGLSEEYLDTLPPEKEERSGILCVARFEELKNQMVVIEATKDMAEQVTFVGDPASNNPSYYNRCKKAASANHSFRPHASMSALRMLYRSHKVVVVPSHFETFGLTVLEALSQGCSVVVSQNVGALEILKEHVHVFNPEDIEGLKSKLKTALKEETPREGILAARELSWDKAAARLKELYATRLSV